jgi:peptidoglycan/LPS O-acetylase OafA/YrhL
MNASNVRFPLLDSMRAIAAVSVLAFHAAGLFGGALVASHPCHPTSGASSSASISSS